MELPALLPPGVGLGPVAFWPLLAALVTHVSLRVAYAVASRPLDTTDGAPWTEVARRADPVRRVHAGTVVLPGVSAAMAAYAVGPASVLPPRVIGILAFLAAYAVAVGVAARMERRVLGVSAAPGWWRRVAVGWIVKMPHLLVIGIIVLAMPASLDAWARAVFALGGLALWRCGQGDGVRIARAVRLLHRSARLDAVVARAAQRMGVPAPRALVLPSLHHEAYALPSSRTLLFSNRAVEELLAEELEAICGHEIGHVAEPARVTAQRGAAFIFLLPFAGARPLIGSLGAGPFAFFVLLFLGFAVARRGWSRRLEHDADAAAAAHEPDPGRYARALLHMYQANVMPAVVHGSGGTHPHLYDRLVAAGSTPDWPRPAPPSRARGLGAVLAAVLLTAAGWIGFEILRSRLRAPHDPGGSRAAQLIALTGGNAAEISDLALARFHDGRYADAAALYTHAAELEPQRPIHRANLAIALGRLGRCEEAGVIVAGLPVAASGSARAAAAACRP